MDENIGFENVDLTSIEAVKYCICNKVDEIQSDGSPSHEINKIINSVFDLDDNQKDLFRTLKFNKMSFPDNIASFITSIEKSSKKLNIRDCIDEAFNTNGKVIVNFYNENKNSVSNFILKMMEIILKSKIIENQKNIKLNQSESNETVPNALDEENKKRVVTLITVRDDILNGLDEIKNLTDPDSTELMIKGLINPYGISVLLLGFALLLGFLLSEFYKFNRSTSDNLKNISYQLGELYTPEKESAKDYGYLKTQFDKLSKAETSPPKTKGSSLPKIIDPIPAVTTESNKGTLSLDEIAPTLKVNLDDLDKKIKALKQISEKVEVKLDDAKIKEVFNSIVKDDNSDFGKMIKKINGTGDKKVVDTVDTTSVKDKKELASLKIENDKLNKSIGERDKEISKEKASVTILNGEVDKKNKEIDKLETKLKSIGDEKAGFKGLTGNFAILFTNSKDFPLNQSILSTAFTLIEKQPKDQKFGVYIATGNQIAVNLDLRDKKEKSLNLISPTGSPTEMLSDAGQAFLDYAFDGKNAIPIPDRKAIIIATWSAEAPKFNSSGWKDISQVDAILIQPANVQQIRYAKSWLDFVNQKNGRLLLISGPDNFDAGSENLKQLSKQISTLLNTKKD